MVSRISACFQAKALSAIVPDYLFKNLCLPTRLAKYSVSHPQNIG